MRRVKSKVVKLSDHRPKHPSKFFKVTTKRLSARELHTLDGCRPALSGNTIDALEGAIVRMRPIMEDSEGVIETALERIRGVGAVSVAILPKLPGAEIAAAEPVSDEGETLSSADAAREAMGRLASQDKEALAALIDEVLSEQGLV